MHEALPDDFAERIAQLRVDGVTVGYLWPRLVELYSKKRPMRYGVDFDVVLLQNNGEWTTIDFADPEIESFKERASSGELNLQGQIYALHWLDRDETARVKRVHFGMAGDGADIPDRDRWPEGRLARIESGELDGMYMLVFPETAGRWIVYVSEDPETMAHESPHQEDWGLTDDQALERSLAAREFSWVRGKDEALIEERIFGVRDAVRRRQARKGWLRDLLNPSRRRPR